MEFLERNFVGGLWQVHPGDEMAAQDGDLDLISVKICRRGLFQTLHTAANHAGRRQRAVYTLEHACMRTQRRTDESEIRPAAGAARPAVCYQAYAHLAP